MKCLSVGSESGSGSSGTGTGKLELVPRPQRGQPSYKLGSWW